MKKIFIIPIILCSASILSGAQDMYDALKYSETNYYGTARSIALGNAVTALGGDPGSITINPAGSAVNSYSQFELSPGLSISNVRASYSPIARSDEWTNSSTTTKTRAIFPNIAAVLNFEGTGSLRTFSVGIVANSTAMFSDKMSIAGINEYSSMMGAMAAAADGNLYSDLDAANAYSNSKLSWTDVLAYKSYMIGEYGDYDDRYLASTEKVNEDGSISMMGPLEQRFNREHFGARTDFVLNLAANFNDNLYIGCNLGMPVMNYNERLYSYESPLDENDFSLKFNGQPTNLVRGYKGYYLATRASGAYMRIGGIYRFDDLRIGAAFQTPTWYSVEERWGWEAQTTFSSFKEYSETPEGRYTYNFITPMVFDFGIAYTISNCALVSLDWERVNNTTMKFRSKDRDTGWDEFADVNDAISEYAGKTNSFRMGGEYKFASCLAARLGYTRKSVKTESYKDVTRAWSFGFGYSSDGSFYADIAFRNTRYPESWFYPYDDYIKDNTGKVLTPSPEINVGKKAVKDIVLTLGWRF